MWIPGGRIFRVEGTARTKALQWGHAWLSEWPEPRAEEEPGGSGQLGKGLGRPSGPGSHWKSLRRPWREVGVFRAKEGREPTPIFSDASLAH